MHGQTASVTLTFIRSLLHSNRPDVFIGYMGSFWQGAELIETRRDASGRAIDAQQEETVALETQAQDVMVQ